MTITGGRFTLDLHNYTIAGKTSDYREGVVTVTGGQLRIENGTLENLYTGNDSKAQALTLLGTDTHVTLANVTAIGATPPTATPAPPSMPPTAPVSPSRAASSPAGCRHLRLCSDGDAPRLPRRRHLPQRPVLLHPRDGGQRRHPSGHSEGGLCAGPRRRHAGGSGYRALLQPPLRHLYAQRRGAGGGPTPTTSAADGRATVAAAMPAPTTARCRTATLRCRSAPCAASPTALPSRTCARPPARSSSMKTTGGRTS